MIAYIDLVSVSYLEVSTKEWYHSFLDMSTCEWQSSQHKVCLEVAGS